MTGENGCMLTEQILFHFLALCSPLYEQSLHIEIQNGQFHTYFANINGITHPMEKKLKTYEA